MSGGTSINAPLPTLDASSERISMKKAAILGATGPTGKHLASELLARGVSVRVVSRSEANLARAFETRAVERITANLLKREEIPCAIAGCDAVFHCLGLPAENMGDHPVAARNLADAIKDSGIRCVHVSSYWSYIPIRHLPVNEQHPRVDGNHAVRMRREAEAILQEAGAAIAHLPDFYGPEVRVSTLQRALEEAVAGKAVRWIGSPGVEREYIFVRDAMEAIAELALCPQAYGERWVIPGPGPIAFHEVASIIERHLGRPVRIKGTSQLALRLAAWIMPDVQAILPMAPTYIAPIHYDGSKLRALLGEVPTTPYDQAIPLTLDWLSSHSTPRTQHAAA